MGPIVVSVQLWLHLRDPQSWATAIVDTKKKNLHSIIFAKFNVRQVVQKLWFLLLYPLPLPLPLPLVALLPEDTCCALTAHANSSTPPSRAILLTSIALRCFCQLRVYVGSSWIVLEKVTPLSSRSGVRVVSFEELLRLRLDLLHSLCSYLDLETVLALEKRCSLGGRCSEMARVYALVSLAKPGKRTPTFPFPLFIT